MSPETFKKNVLPELISRFDYICQFNQLQKGDKERFLNDYLKELKEKKEKDIFYQVNM